MKRAPWFLVVLLTTSCADPGSTTVPSSSTTAASTSTTSTATSTVEAVVNALFADIQAGDFSFLSNGNVTFEFGYGPVRYDDPVPFPDLADFDEDGVTTWGDQLLHDFKWLDAFHTSFPSIECIAFAPQAQCTVLQDDAFSRLADTEVLPYVLTATTEGQNLTGLTWDFDSQPAEGRGSEIQGAKFFEWLELNDPGLFNDLMEQPPTASMTDRVRTTMNTWLSLMGSDPSPDALVPTWVTLHPTHTVAVGSQTVDVFNGTDLLVELTEWALGRYELAGIGLPYVISITFPPNPLCRRYQGVTTNSGDGSRVFLCFDESELAPRDTDPFGAVARRTMLHELGHAWSNTYLTAEDRDRFVELRRLEYWSGSDVAYSQRGTEHAAEILAWGLLEEPSVTVRLPDLSCDSLAEAFRFLTGIDPLFDLTDCDPRL